MIQDLDETLQELLSQELSRKWKSTDFGISFAAPDKEVASSIDAVATTINLFLYDIRENLELRSNEWIVERQNNGSALKYPPPVRVDCSYLITVWCANKEIKQEHHFLGDVMKILMRYPKIPNEFLRGSLQGKEPPLRTMALRPPQSQNWSEFWQVMGGKPKAILSYTVTIAVDVHEPVEAGKLVQESIINYSQLGE
ncbi:MULTISPECIES: DUF4255 domain-containing protein [unclassified Microcoleus]|uniref:DUF4255 domain-containing protein n=1 Tax=unclassified Microcoleus TaxID=2642155 RepID=UPI002FD3E593